jgi:hypothetical protein
LSSQLIFLEEEEDLVATLDDDLDGAAAGAFSAGSFFGVADLPLLRLLLRPLEEDSPLAGDLPRLLDLLLRAIVR